MEINFSKNSILSYTRIYYRITEKHVYSYTEQMYCSIHVFRDTSSECIIDIMVRNLEFYRLGSDSVLIYPDSKGKWNILPENVSILWLYYR